MTRAFHIPATAFASTMSPAKTRASATMIGDRQVGVRTRTNANANALATRRALC